MSGKKHQHVEVVWEWPVLGSPLVGECALSAQCSMSCMGHSRMNGFVVHPPIPTVTSVHEPTMRFCRPCQDRAYGHYSLHKQLVSIALSVRKVFLPKAQNCYSKLSVDSLIFAQWGAKAKYTGAEGPARKVSPPSVQHMSNSLGCLLLCATATTAVVLFANITPFSMRSSIES